MERSEQLSKSPATRNHRNWNHLVYSVEKEWCDVVFGVGVVNGANTNQYWYSSAKENICGHLYNMNNDLLRQSVAVDSGSVTISMYLMLTSSNKTEWLCWISVDTEKWKKDVRDALCPIIDRG